MLSTIVSTKRAYQLPAAVERELVQLEGRHGQRADSHAQHRLAGLGEAAAVRVLQRIGESQQPVQNLSAYIQWMAGFNASQDAACGSIHPERDESAMGPMYNHAGAQMEEEICNGEIPFDSSKRVRIEPAASLACRMLMYSSESPVRLHTDSTTRQLPPQVADHEMMQVGTSAPNAMFSPARMVSTPSPLRNITRRFHEIAGPSRTVGVETALSLACMMPAEPLVDENALRATASPQMVALGDLEFVKVFLIHVYLAGKKIEDVCELHEEYIRSLHSLPMEHFESEIWHRFGHKFVAETDRRKNLDWDPSKASVYHCCIEKAEDSVVTIFKGPYRENTRNKLQKVVGDDNILIVNFSEIPGHRNIGDNIGTHCSYYQQFAEDGIILGLRRYRFLIFKNGGKEKRKKDGNQKYSSSVKCYFVRTESGWDRDEPYILSNKTIDEARKMFMHIHTVPTVAKYLARFSLVLSKATTLLDANDLSNVNVITIDDVPCKDTNGSIILNHGDALIHTDGTGLISEDLAKKCPASVFKGNLLGTNDLHPVLMQMRMFYDGLVAKGTLLVDRRLPPRTINIRPSMIKVSPDPNLLDGQSFNSLEIVSTSNRPKRAYTSKVLITLLHYGGVPVDYFLELQRKAVKDVEKACYNTSDSLEVAYNHADMDDSMSARMILSGIHPEDEAYLKYQLSEMIREEREGIKLGRIPIDETYNLIGATDPTGTLKPNEVCVIHENGQLSGEVLVYRYPGLHFGDIHVLTATHIPDLEKNIVGFSKYVILFPISGPRSLADEMAGGDHDGDSFFVSRNPQLLEHFRPSEAWVQRVPPKKTVQKKPQNFNGPDLEILLFHEFLKTRFTPSYVMSTAADCWLVYMDQLLTSEVQEHKREMIKTKMLELCDIYYEALDAPKTGNKIDIPHTLKVKEYPHYMDGKTHRTYHSTSVLGKIYDQANAMSQQYDIFPSVNIAVLTCFTEEVVTKECREQWTSHYQDYRRESTSFYGAKYSKEERNKRFLELYQKYKRILYHSEEFNESPRNHNEVFGEACAIYQIVYQYAIRRDNISLCGFAWKVAGRALCQLHTIKRGGQTVLCSHSVLRDAFKRKR